MAQNTSSLLMDFYIRSDFFQTRFEIYILNSKPLKCCMSKKFGESLILNFVIS